VGIDMIAKALSSNKLFRYGWVLYNEKWHELSPEHLIAFDEMFLPVDGMVVGLPGGSHIRTWRSFGREHVIDVFLHDARVHETRSVLVSLDATETLSWIWDKTFPKQEYDGSLWQICSLYHKLRMADPSECRTFHLERFQSAIEELPEVFYVARD